MANSWKRSESKKEKRKRFASRIYAAVFILMIMIAAAFILMLVIVDAFPAAITVPVLAVLAFSLAAVALLFISGKGPAGVIGMLLALAFFATFGTGIFYLSKTYETLAKVTAASVSVDASDASADAADPSAGSADPSADAADPSADSAQGASSGSSAGRYRKTDFTKEPFNLYITGIDQWEYEKGRDLDRSDVNMIVTVNPQTRKILLTSIPRDSFVMLHTAQQMDKLTHTGVYGVDETLDTVSDWLGVDLPYYVKMNFTAVVEIIDAIGGIDVYSPKSFVPVKRKQWTVKKGWNHMNGKEALAFARERKAFDGEDSMRVENQQRVVDAILKKMMTSPALLLSYPDILEAAGSNITTNLTPDDLKKVVKMQIAELGSWDIEKQKIDGKYELDYVASLTKKSRFLVYKTYDASVTKVKAEIEATIDPSESEIREASKKRRRSFFSQIIESMHEESKNE